MIPFSARAVNASLFFASCALAGALSSLAEYVGADGAAAFSRSFSNFGFPFFELFSPGDNESLRCSCIAFFSSSISAFRLSSRSASALTLPAAEEDGSEEALKANDTVLIGDLLEYEIKPRLLGLPAGLAFPGETES